MDEPASKKPPKRPLHRRRWPYIVLALLATGIAVIGPWPTYSDSWHGTDYAAATHRAVAALDADRQSGPLQAGVGRRPLPLTPGMPMAGYGARSPMVASDIATPLWARAVTISNGHRTVTLIGGDLLLFMPSLRQAVLDRLADLQIPEDDLYFTSTHTHSGPGGYGPRWIDQIVLGRYDEAAPAALAEAFAGAVRDSRARQAPVRLAAGMVEVRGADGEPLVENRIVGGPADSHLRGLLLEGLDGQPLAFLMAFDAHPTCLGPESRSLHGDYPALVQDRLDAEAPDRMMSLMAAGAVGSARTRSGVPRGRPRLHEAADAVIPQALALLNVLRGPDGDPAADAGGPPPRRLLEVTEAPIAAARVPVDLPPLQVRLGESLRLSPVVSGYVHERRSWIHLLRIGPVLLIGMPGDFSTGLRGPLDEALPESVQLSIVTSFNGDYIGYITPHAYYGTGTYEVRAMNFFGPWLGEYLVDVTGRAAGRIMGTKATGNAGADVSVKSDSP